MKLLIRHAEDEKKYLYDLVEVKKSPSAISIDVADATHTMRAEDSNKNITDNNNDVNIEKQNTKDIVNVLTGEKISKQAVSVLEQLEQGKDVTLEAVQNIPEIQQAYKKIENVEPTVNMSGREEIRRNAIEKLEKMGSWRVDENGKGDYNGDVRKDGRIDIVIGLPASGKSSVLVNPLSQKYKSRVIDSDMAKELLPEFDNGWGAGAVHEESKLINKQWLKDSIRSGENIVLPIVGSDYSKVIGKITNYKKASYSVYVHLNELPMNKSLGRMIRRFFTDGRFLDPYLSFKYQNKPTEVYEKIKKEGVLDGYSKYSNDVKYGEQARYVEGEKIFSSDKGDMGTRREVGRETREGNVGRNIPGKGYNEVRHSLSNISPTEDIIEENKHLKDMVNILKEEFALTKGRLPSRSQIDQVCNKLTREYGSSYEMMELIVL